MPVNCELEAKKGVERTKFSLSLNRKNASYLSNESSVLNEASKENSNANKNKEHKSAKRPFSSTYFNTLNAAKKLKTVGKSLTELTIVTEKESKDSKSVASSSAMLNGHQTESGQFGGNSGAPRKTPIATLSNLGNTCFLNSVLYTLRYAPRFLHHLHHLVSDLASVEQKLGSIRLKSSSLGRSAVGLASSGARSWSSKDLLSLGQSDTNSGKSKIQVVTERLHETYANLRIVETKCMNSNSSEATPDPYGADAFLCALREVNATFEGNRQQDAHELWVCILDNIRETCRALSLRASRIQLYENGDSNGGGRQGSVESEGGKPTLGLRKSWKKRKERAPSPPPAAPLVADAPAVVAAPEDARPGFDFVADNFEGTMVVRTMCMECETVTENKQAVLDIGIPVPDEEDYDDDEPFRATCLSSEYLRDQNKYWCSRCLRYNEARRSVAYSRLPRLLVMHLKRFSGGMEKITRHAPTPLLMTCFCELCVRHGADQPPPDRYALWAVIMHLGQSLSGGHYVAYARVGADTGAGEACGRGADAGAAPGGFMRSLFGRGRAAGGCGARECCVPRARAAAGWLVCDDDLVKPISDEEFEELLSAEPKVRSAATPYLLFYVKTDRD